MNKALLEKLAELEHEQWISWEDYRERIVSTKLISNQLNWSRLRKISYKDLSEREKESDREWARRALLLIQDFYAKDEKSKGAKDE